MLRLVCVPPLKRVACDLRSTGASYVPSYLQNSCHQSCSLRCMLSPVHCFHSTDSLQQQITPQCYQAPQQLEGEVVIGSDAIVQVRGLLAAPIGSCVAFYSTSSDPVRHGIVLQLPDASTTTVGLLSRLLPSFHSPAFSSPSLPSICAGTTCRYVGPVFVVPPPSSSLVLSPHLSSFHALTAGMSAGTTALHPLDVLCVDSSCDIATLRRPSRSLPSSHRFPLFSLPRVTHFTHTSPDYPLISSILYHPSSPSLSQCRDIPPTFSAFSSVPTCPLQILSRFSSCSHAGLLGSPALLLDILPSLANTSAVFSCVGRGAVRAVEGGDSITPPTIVEEYLTPLVAMHACRHLLTQASVHDRSQLLSVCMDVDEHERACNHMLACMNASLEEPTAALPLSCFQIHASFLDLSSGHITPPNVTNHSVASHCLLAAQIVGQAGSSLAQEIVEGGCGSGRVLRGKNREGDVDLFAMAKDELARRCGGPIGRSWLEERVRLDVLTRVVKTKADGERLEEMRRFGLFVDYWDEEEYIADRTFCALVQAALSNRVFSRMVQKIKEETRRNVVADQVGEERIGQEDLFLISLIYLRAVWLCDFSESASVLGHTKSTVNISSLVSIPSRVCVTNEQAILFGSGIVSGLWKWRPDIVKYLKGVLKRKRQRGGQPVSASAKDGRAEDESALYALDKELRDIPRNMKSEAGDK
eukprot:GHVS01008095.1.p1 GENE.GHVS01008095.1~~GHVS01008095.1.p1  ORF type:complete len:698 (-),score=69.12 GHVS01008095.1:512-2605(-)